jgi:hypothetical protein
VEEGRGVARRALSSKLLMCGSLIYKHKDVEMLLRTFQIKLISPNERRNIIETVVRRINYIGVDFIE